MARFASCSIAALAAVASILTVAVGAAASGDAGKAQSSLGGSGSCVVLSSFSQSCRVCVGPGSGPTDPHIEVDLINGQAHCPDA